MTEDLGDKAGSTRFAPEAASASSPKVTIPIARHTSGPWTLGEWSANIFVYGGPNNDDIAEFNFADEHTVKITREEAIANARLFLAAPDLLAALHCFLADERFQVAVGGNPNVVEQMLADARAAYFKATEGTPPLNSPI